MFCGKSEDLIRRLRRVEIAGQRVLIVKAGIDDRYDISHVVTHGGAKMRAVNASSAGEVRRLARVDGTCRVRRQAPGRLSPLRRPGDPDPAPRQRRARPVFGPHDPGRCARRLRSVLSPVLRARQGRRQGSPVSASSARADRTSGRPSAGARYTGGEVSQSPVRKCPARCHKVRPLSVRHRNVPKPLPQNGSRDGGKGPDRVSQSPAVHDGRRRVSIGAGRPGRSATLHEWLISSPV